MLDILVHGLPPGEPQGARELDSAVTLEDVVPRVARGGLTPGRYTVVPVGEARAFACRPPGADFDSHEIVPLTEPGLWTCEPWQSTARRQGHGDASRP